MLRCVTSRAAGHRSTFAVVTAVNLAVAAVVLVCGIMAPSMRALWLGVAVVVTLALAALVALARWQGATRDEVPLAPRQWAFVIAIWAGIVLGSVTSTWSMTIAWAEPVSVASLTDAGTPLKEESTVPTLTSISRVAARVASLAWLALVIYLTTRVGGRGRARAQNAAPAGPLSRWPDLVFTVLIPGHLVTLAWVAQGGGSTNGSGWEGVAHLLIVAPILFVLLAVPTVQMIVTAWSVHGPRLTSGQAWLQIGMWASLLAVGAGVTFPSMKDHTGSPRSAVLLVLPGHVDLSEAIAWAGVAGFVATYVLLTISLRARRVASLRARRDAAPTGRGRTHESSSTSAAQA